VNKNIKTPSATGKLKVLIYGHPGHWKTRFVGSCGELGPTLLLRPPTDTTASIAGWPNVKEWVIRDHGELEDAYQEVRSSREWSWVWLDSISQWQDTGLDDIWNTVLTEKPARARYGLDQGEYGINMFRISQWVRHMAAQADEGFFNFGITAHPRELSPFEDGEGKEMMMPWIQGRNMAPKICGYMHIVGFIEITKEGKRVLRTESGPRYYAVDRFHAVPKGRLLEPTAKKLVQAIVQNGKPTQPKRTTRLKPMPAAKPTVKTEAREAAKNLQLKYRRASK